MTTTDAHPGAAAPIACSLSAADFRDRRREIASLAAHALRSRTPIDDGERLTFADGDDTERQLIHLAAAEAACCPFLTLDLRRHGGELTLDVTGPPDARPIIEELFA